MNERKIGWTVSETIGVAVVNPRAVNKMNIISEHYFHNDQGGIRIRQYSIEIIGSIEAAAKMFAEAVMSVEGESFRYLNVICASRTNGIYRVDLTEDGMGLIDQDVWAQFKKDVERICNRLKAFL